MIARWKGIIEEIHFGASIMPLTIIENLDPEKPSFRPSKWPRKLKTAKNSKLPKLPENCFEPVGKGGWPPISTWINPPSLGSNGLHCVEFPGEREKRLLNLHLGECLPCWRRRAAQFVEVCHEPVEAEVVQQVEIHERMV
jgi:hypothetical protein